MTPRSTDSFYCAPGDGNFVQVPAVQASARPTIANSRTFRVAANHRPRTVDLRGIAILSIESHRGEGLLERNSPAM